jgi:hypothetical protein
MKKTNQSRGQILMPLLFIVIAFGILMTSGAMINKSATNPTEQYGEDSSDIGPANQNLQLKTLKFKRFIPPTLDCGNGKIQGISEPYILWAIDPAPGNIVQKDGKIKVFYQDEWPITLGKGTVTEPKSSQDHAINPNVGDETAKDSNGFPFYPAIFISDITTDPANTDGDVQSGGKPHKPDEIFGAWKALNSNTAPFPANALDLGPGADPFPKESNVKFDGQNQRFEPSYGAEMIWEVKNLGLTDGHIYRAQIILHDGDRGEGDISEACTTIQY